MKPEGFASNTTDISRQREDFYRAVIRGLAHRPARIEPKYFYDEIGSRLFERICDTPEYYLTRTERLILQNNSSAIAAAVGKDCTVIEPGAGNAQKIRLLLNDLRPASYIPIDISAQHLQTTAESLRKEFPWLEVKPYCGDFADNFDLRDFSSKKRRLIFFPGSTIGNFEPQDLSGFLKRVLRLLQPDGLFLVGIDLIKDSALLNAAYNDAQGITAAFNLNLLHRMQRELGACVKPEQFRHRASYVAAEKRVEMHLVSLCDQEINLAGEDYRFCHGESIHTENSYKYDPVDFRQLVQEHGFHVRATWSDPQHCFSLFLLSTYRRSLIQAYQSTIRRTKQ